MSALLLVPRPAEAEDVSVSGQAWKEYLGNREWESVVGAKFSMETAGPESFGERDFSHTELNIVTSACVE